ncbi:MAG TPA: hypothetical protein VLA19_17375 [Herpetosiphonaceae bacterium]|nr:hypothetical protein [Herpetosiphonaceae bacterium]
MAKLQVNFLVADDYLQQFSRVLQHSQAAGFEVANAFEETGIATGSIDESRLGDLEQVEGIAAVEIQRTFQLPTPSDDLQ